MNGFFQFLILSSKFLSFIQAYKLSDSYDSTNFFDNFEFEAIPDPTGGSVKYVNKTTALSAGLATYTNNKVYIGVGKFNIICIS